MRYSTRPRWPIRLERAIEDAADIVHGPEIGQERNKVRELGVVRVVEPSRDGYGVVRVEDVGCGRVVDNDARLHRPTKLREILPRVSLLTLAVAQTLRTLT